MKRLGAAFGLAVAVALTISPAAGQETRQVILVMMPGIPYEEAIREPILRDLARNGGIGLMTTSGEAQHPAQAAVSLGAGATADAAPDETVSFEEIGPGLGIDAEPYRELAGDAEPGLLATIVAENGMSVGYVDLGGAQGDPAMLLAMDVRGRIPVAFLNTFPVLGDLPPEFLGGSGSRIVRDVNLLISPDPAVIPFALEQSRADEAMVIVAATPPSKEMRGRGDTVSPLILAGTPVELLEGRGSPRGLTSDTTRRDGVVSNIDVAPTILDFLGAEVPKEMVGSSIVIEGEPPGDLHRRYLEWRGVVTPVGQAVLGLAIASLVAGFVMLMARWRPPGSVARVLAIAGLASLAVLVMFVPASLLPSFGWPAVLSTLIIGGAILVLLGTRLGRGDPARAVALVSVVGLVVVVLDVAAGWRSGSTPLLGGSALDGERFFGLGNPYAGIVLSGAVLGAAVLPAIRGVLLIAAAALFAGLPFLGADVGGAITLAVAAALWFAVNRWGKLGWPAFALAAGAAIAAVLIVILSHRLLPPGATHVSRAIESPGGVLGALEIFWERLMLNVRTTSEVPSAWLAVLGLPFWLWVAVRSPAALRPPLEPGSPWQRAIVVLAVSGMVGYVVNDTFGTASIAFLFLSAAVIYPALAARLKERSPATSSRPTAPAAG